MGLLGWILHVDYVKELEGMYSRIAEKKITGMYLYIQNCFHSGARIRYESNLKPTMRCTSCQFIVNDDFGIKLIIMVVILKVGRIGLYLLFLESSSESLLPEDNQYLHGIRKVKNASIKYTII